MGIAFGFLSSRRLPEISARKMRPLTEEETKIFFEKLSKYIGDNIKSLIERDDGNYCFRLHRERVFYVAERIMKQAAHVARENLLSLGTCFGKFTKKKIQAPRDCARLPGAVRESQDLAEGVGRAAVSLRTQCGQIGARQDHGKHGQVPGRRRVLYE